MTVSATKTPYGLRLWNEAADSADRLAFLALGCIRGVGYWTLFTNQLETIHLERLPTKTKMGDHYKAPPIKAGKTILVVDDICTQGNSFEAARVYIEKTGARSISMAWLKTINTDYEEISGPVAILDPYAKSKFALGTIPTKTHYYSTAITNGAATSDLSDIFKRYYGWQWPTV